MIAILLTVALLLGILIKLFEKQLNLDTRITHAIAKIRRYQARLTLMKDNPALSLMGQIGAASMSRILDGLVVILIGVVLVFQFAPLIESNSSTTNITNTTTKTFGSLASWLLPTIAILGLIYLGIRLFLHFGKKD